MMYIRAERGTYQKRCRIDREGMSVTYGPPYFDLVVFWCIDGDSGSILPITIDDVNNQQTSRDLYLGELTTLLPQDARVVR